MKRFLGLTDEEVAENERLWREENDENLQPFPIDAPGEMRGVGIWRRHRGRHGRSRRR